MVNDEDYSNTSELIKNRMIRVKSETANVLSEMRIANRESYDEIIKRILIQLKIIQTKKIRNSIESDFVLSDEAKIKINEGLKDMRGGKVLSTDELFKRLYGHTKSKPKI